MSIIRISRDSPLPLVCLTTTLLPLGEHENAHLEWASRRLSTLPHIALWTTPLLVTIRRSSEVSVKTGPASNLRVMFPLISTMLELRQAKMVLADVMEDLDEHGIEYNRSMPVGMMVEVPAAVIMIDRFV